MLVSGLQRHLRTLAGATTPPSSMDHFGFRCHVLYHVDLLCGVFSRLRRHAGFSTVLQVRTDPGGSNHCGVMTNISKGSDLKLRSGGGNPPCSQSY